MQKLWSNGIALGVIFSAQLCCGPQLWAHSYGPLARLTAGAGDNPVACTACHVGVLNSGSGSVSISVPSGKVYIPGVKQRVTVQVSDIAQQRWGFEASARLNSDLAGGQAGSLGSVDNFTQVICEDNGPAPCATGVQFIQHTTAGTRNGTKNGATFQFDWTPPATNVGPVTLFVAGNAANGDGTSAGDHIYTSSIQLTPVTPSAPVVTAANILSAATYAAGPVTANTWMTVYGTNLGVTTRAWADSDFTDGAMPTSLDGVSVVLTANGAPRRAYVGYVSPTQVNFLLPSDLGNTTVQVQIRNGAGITAQAPITTQANAAQMLTLDGKYVLGLHANNSVLSKASPAAPGETLTLYYTGGGATTPALVNGQTPLTTSAANTIPVVTLGGKTVAVASAGAVPGSPGVYQMTVQVPSDAVNGDAALGMQLGAFTAATVSLAVQK
jgi:uncharacterized protein (TIGR03437 family)